jgi:hypothetical protein
MNQSRRVEMARFLKDSDGEWVMRSDWHIDDVVGCGIDNGVDLSEDEVMEVMQMIAKRFDANLGINWEVIEAYIIYRYVPMRSITIGQLTRSNEMVKKKGNNMTRDDLIESLAAHVVDGMDVDSLVAFATERLEDEYAQMSNDDFAAEVSRVAPDMVSDLLKEHK